MRRSAGPFDVAAEPDSEGPVAAVSSPQLLGPEILVLQFGEQPLERGGVVTAVVHRAGRRGVRHRLRRQKVPAPQFGRVEA